MEICGRNTKTLALIAGSPFPFPFRAFLSPPPLFATATLAIVLSVIVCFDFVLFNSYSGFFKTNSFYINYKMSTFEKHMVLTILHQEK